MEQLWAELENEPNSVSSPVWHHSELQERRQLAAEGKLKFLNWATVFQELREELGRDSPY